MINRKDYPHPVSKLISRGRPSGRAMEPEQWFDYVGHYGLGEMDVPSLVGLATEERRFNKKRPNEFYAPIHAIRALGQLGDMAAADFLVKLLDQHEDDDLAENVIMALTMVGPHALKRLAEYFDHPFTHSHSRLRAVEAIYLFAQRQPQQRDWCVQFITEALANYHRQSATINGFLVHYLTLLGVSEAAEVISQAFAAGRVEDDLCGPWPAVQVALGLAKESDFTPDELRSRGDKELDRQWQESESQSQPRQIKQPTPMTGLSGSYSITEHLKR